MIKIIDIDQRIKEKGLKKSFIIDKLNLSKATFYRRMKDKEFTFEETKKLKDIGVL